MSLDALKYEQYKAYLLGLVWIGDMLYNKFESNEGYWWPK
jgi:hypothetical protein